MVKLYKKFDFEGKEGFLHRKYITTEEEIEIKVSALRDVNKALKKVFDSIEEIELKDRYESIINIDLIIKNERAEAKLIYLKDFNEIDQLNPTYLNIPSSMKIKSPKNISLYLRYLRNQMEVKEKIAIEKPNGQVITRNRKRDDPTIEIEVSFEFFSPNKNDIEESFEYRDKIVEALKNVGYKLKEEGNI